MVFVLDGTLLLWSAFFYLWYNGVMDILSSSATVGAVLGLVQALKMAGLPTRYAPITSVLIGLSAAYLFVGVTSATTFAGIVLGLSASGLWSGVKTTTGN